MLPIVGPTAFSQDPADPVLSDDTCWDPVRLSPYVGPANAPVRRWRYHVAGSSGLPSAMALFVPVWFALGGVPSGWQWHRHPFLCSAVGAVGTGSARPEQLGQERHN